MRHELLDTVILGGVFGAGSAEASGVSHLGSSGLGLPIAAMAAMLLLAIHWPCRPASDGEFGRAQRNPPPSDR